MRKGARLGPAGLSLCLIASTTSCFSARYHAEQRAAKIERGMDERQVRQKLGPPRDRIPVPGQPDDPELPVEVWSYGYESSFWTKCTILATLGIGMFFMDKTLYTFNVSFGRDKRVVGVSPVRP